MLRNLVRFDDVAPEIAWKLVDTLFTQNTTMITGAVVFILYGLAGYFGTGSGWYLGGVAYTAGVFLWRFSQSIRYARARNSATPVVWAMRSLRSCWAIGVGWGAWSAVALFEPEKSLVIMLIGMQSGLIMGTVVRNCAVPTTAIGQVLLSSIPAVVFCFLTFDRYLQAYAVILIIFTCAAVALIKTLHRQMLQLLLKEQEKSSLVDRLEIAKQDLEVINQHLETLVATDALTGVANRRAFDLAAAREWRHCARECTPLSLLMIDVDDFKAFNDFYGHQAGDTCLREVAAATASTMHRPRDVLARYGGEEFAVVLPATPLDSAMQIAEDVLAAIRSRALGHQASVFGHVTVSIGAACMVPTPDFGVEGLTAAADAALYDAKRGGRNRVGAAKAGPGAASPALEPASDIAAIFSLHR